MKKTVPMGEQYERYQKKMQKKYADNPKVLADMGMLTSKLCNWYIGCFARLILEMQKKEKA